MHRRSLVALAAVCLSVLGTPAAGRAGATPSRPAAAAATAVRTIDPLDRAGHLTARYTVDHHYPDANCVAGSPTTGTAYECFAAQSPQGVFDTCWVQASPGYVTCLPNPWTTHAVRLHVTGGYDDGSGFRRVAAPWGVRLKRSIRCLVDLGSVKSADGHPITYRCTRHIVLTGAVMRSAATWRVRAYRRVAHRGHATTFTALGHQPVSVGWRGRASRPGGATT
jgi:hypothetical protein